MTDAQWKRVHELYEVAHGLTPEEAERFVAGLSDDAEIAAELKALLAEPPAEDPDSGLSFSGRKLGAYEVLHRVGRGASADVYAGRDTRLDRLVAMKFLKSGHEGVSRKFLCEAQSVSSLNHPNIVTIHEVLDSPTEPVLVMELVEGESLRQRCARSIPEREAVRIGLQIALALAAAHGKGFVHRDLKPENVMVRPDGYVKVLDFGLARRWEESGGASNLTSTAGLPVGTLRYMSPEQCKGERATPKSDMFALGLILHEMLAGRHPFADAGGLEVAHALVNEKARPLGAVSPALRGLVEQLLMKDAEARPAAQETVTRLEALSGAGPLPAETAHSAAWSRRQMAGAALCIAAAGGGVAAWWRLRGTRTTGPLLEGGLIRDPVFSPDGSKIVFSWRKPGGRAYLLYVLPVAGGEPVALTHGIANDYDAAWSPDGGRISFVRSGRGESAVYVMAPDGSRIHRVTTIQFDSDWNSHASWFSAERLVVADQVEDGVYRLYFVDVGTGKREEAGTASSGLGEGTPRISPDGRQLAYTRFFGTNALDLFVRPVAGGPERRLTFNERPKREVRWSPDGRSIFYRAPKPLWRLWQVGVNGEAEKLVPLPHSALGNFDLHAGPGGKKQIVIAQTSERLSIWRSDRTPGGGFAPPASSIASGPESLDVNPVISPDGQKIAFVSTRTGYPELWVADADGSNPQQVTSLEQRPVTVPAWTADSRGLLSAARIGGSGQLFLVDARAGAQPRIIPRPEVANSEPQFSPDFRFITYSARLAGRHELFRAPVEGGRAEQLTRNGCVIHRHSPDGKWIYFIKTNETSGLFRMAATGGEEQLVLRQVKSALYRGWAIGRGGIYYTVEVEGGGRWEIRYYDEAQDSHTPVVQLPFPLPRWSGTLSIARDESWMVFPMQEPAGSELLFYPDVNA